MYGMLTHFGNMTSLKPGDVIRFDFAEATVSAQRNQGEDSDLAFFVNGIRQEKLILQNAPMPAELAFGIARLLASALECDIEEAASLPAGTIEYRLISP